MCIFVWPDWTDERWIKDSRERIHPRLSSWQAHQIAVCVLWYTCFANLVLYLTPHFLFLPHMMPLNRVIVLTVRQAAVCMCVYICALLLQGADSREVCLNREGAQRPCSSCRVWNWIIGPPFSLSICRPVYLSVSLFLFFGQFSLACSNLIAFFCSALHCYLSTHTCAVLCVNSWPPSLFNCLLAVKSAWWLDRQCACYSAYKWPLEACEDRHVFHSQEELHTLAKTHFPTLLFICFCFWCCLFHITALSHVHPHHSRISCIRVFQPLFLSACLLLLSLTFKHITTLHERDERRCTGPRCLCKLANYSEFQDFFAALVLKLGFTLVVFSYLQSLLHSTAAIK